jgi:hypothetical protein
MKKYFNYALAAAFLGSVSLSVTSCKSDEDTVETVVENVKSTTLTIDEGILKNGIEAGMESSVLEVRVKCDGDWFAILSINDDEDDTSHYWVKIQNWKGFYNGDQTLAFQFDENTTGVDRTTKLTLANNLGEIKEVTVRQKYTPTNGSPQSFQNMGIGYGIDYNYLLNLKSIRYRSSAEDASAALQNAQSNGEKVSFNPMKCMKMSNIYHLTTIDKLCKAGSMGSDKDAYVEQPIEISNLQAVMLDSAMSVDKYLNIGLRIQGSVGPVSFDISGKYVDKRREDRNYIDYTIVRNAPMYDVRTSPASIVTYADKHSDVDSDAAANFAKKVQNTRKQFIVNNSHLLDKSILGADSLTASQRSIIDGMYKKMQIIYSFGGVFSSHFEQCYSKLYNYIVLRNAGGMDVASKKADRVCQELDDHYGPFIIAGSQVGGSMVLQMKMDTLRLEGQINVDGKATVEVVVLEGEANAAYREKGFRRLRHYIPTINIYGGNAKDTETALLDIIMSESPDDHSKWTDMLMNWTQSMMSSADEGDMSKAAPISFTAVPIWHFFADTEISGYVRSYFMDKYRTRKIQDYLDIIDEEPSHKTFIELLNDFREDEPDGPEPEFKTDDTTEEDWKDDDEWVTKTDKTEEE